MPNNTDKKYNMLDGHIIRAVRGGANRLYFIQKRIGYEVDLRQIENRMRALKKEGRLVYESKTGWRLTQLDDHE